MTSILLDLKGQKIELTQDEARALRDELLALLPVPPVVVEKPTIVDRWIPSPVVIERDPPQWPTRPMIPWCGGHTDDPLPSPSYTVCGGIHDIRDIPRSFTRRCAQSLS